MQTHPSRRSGNRLAGGGGESDSGLQGLEALVDYFKELTFHFVSDGKVFLGVGEGRGIISLHLKSLPGCYKNGIMGHGGRQSWYMNVEFRIEIVDVALV